MAWFYIHSKETRRESKRKHKSRKNCQVFNRRICIKFKYTLEGILHRVDIFLEKLYFWKDFIELIFQIFKIKLYFFRKSFFHTKLYEFENRNLWFHHMLQGNDVSFSRHDIANSISTSRCEELIFKCLEVTRKSFKHLHRLIEKSLEYLIEEECWFSSDILF